MTNRLIELERHFNGLELNKFGEVGEAHMCRRAFQSKYGPSRYTHLNWTKCCKLFKLLYFFVRRIPSSHACVIFINNKVTFCVGKKRYTR